MNTVPKHIGIVACSAEGAALCYRTICLEALTRVGEHDHPQVTLNSIPMARHMEYIRANNWEGVGALMVESVKRVAQAGAAFAICPDNTLHQAFEYVLPNSPIPWLHIADVVAAEAKRRGFKQVGVMGTKYLMESQVYPGAFCNVGIQYRIPSQEVREKMNTVIFKELVNAVFTEESRLFFNEVMQEFKNQSCDSAVMGCTEIPLIVRTDDTPLPTLDSTRLLAKAALLKAMS